MTSTINEINKINAIISENIEDPIFILNEKLTCEFVNFHDFKEKKNIIEQYQNFCMIRQMIYICVFSYTYL